MSTGKTGSLAQRSSYLSLLQIAGAFSIVAFHIGIPYSQAGWIVVELFFVMAGINMAAACGREQSTAAYAWSRVSRLFPEVCAVWCVTGLFVILGGGTAGMLWFIGTAPLFLQNLTLPVFEYSFPRDWVFTSLWFIATLLQLQVLVFATKRWWLLRAKPVSLIIAFTGFGLSFRLLFALLFGGNPRTLPDFGADALYCLPFSHVEAIILGLMMGRGALPGIGRLLPVFGGLALLTGALNVWLSHGLVNPRSLGFEFPLRLNYIHVWGYSILAFAAASLCARNGPMAVAIERTKRPPWLDQGLARLASLTYGVYVFHGIIMTTGVNGSQWLSREHAPVLRLLLFAITIIESFFLAWVFAWFMQVAVPAILKTASKRRDFGEEIRVAKLRGNKQILPPGPEPCLATILSTPHSPFVKGELSRASTDAVADTCPERRIVTCP